MEDARPQRERLQGARMDRINAVLQELRESRTVDEVPAPDDKKPRAKRWVIALVVIALIAVVLIPRIIGAFAANPTRPVQHTKVTVTKDLAADGLLSPTPLDWKPVVQALDTQRGNAFITRNWLAMMNADIMGSPMYIADRSMIGLLERNHAFIRTWPVRVISVKEQYLTMGEKYPRAMVTVVDEMGAYDIVDKSGRVLRTVPDRGKSQWNVVLQNRPVYGWGFVSSAKSPKR